MFGWFDAREAKQFGTSLAAFYIAQMPASLAVGEKKFAAKTQARELPYLPPIRQLQLLLRIGTGRQGSRIGFFAPPAQMGQRQIERR